MRSNSESTGPMAEATGRIAEMPYFAGLTSRELEAAGRALSPVDVPSGEVIFAQGEDGGWMYLLASGTIDISIEVQGEVQKGSQGERRVLSSLCAPALLGEMSVLLGEPRSAWAVATSPCLLWQVSREDVRRALEANQKWMQRLLLSMSRTLASRLFDTNRQLVDLAAREGSLEAGEVARLQRSLFQDHQDRQDRQGH